MRIGTPGLLRPLVVALPLLLVLPAVPHAAGEGEGEGRPGIDWARDLEAGLRRATLEGRPVLFCVNALENEAANVRLATDLYRSAAWGRATRGYVAFVCNPNDHDGPDGTSTRYPGTTSATAKAALRYVMNRFGSDLISPQHVILEPDGDVAFRKEYYEGVVGPALFESWLVRIAPPTAYTRASIDREARIERLGETATEELAAAAAAWLATNDPFAVPGLLVALDESYDAARRRVLIESLANASPLLAPTVAYGAEERTAWPDDEPAETRAWLRTLFAVDRVAARVAAARVLARSEDAGLRSAVLGLWAGTEAAPASVDALPPDERPAAVEALLLAGDARGRGVELGRLDPDWAARIARARAVAGEAAPPAPALDAARDAPPGKVRRALLDADAEAVRAHRDWIEAQLEASPHARVRVAAALALLRAPSPGRAALVAATVTRGAFDPIEGPDVRPEAVARLGEDPGASPARWTALVQSHVEVAR